MDDKFGSSWQICAYFKNGSNAIENWVWTTISMDTNGSLCVMVKLYFILGMSVIFGFLLDFTIVSEFRDVIFHIRQIIFCL